MYTVRVFNAQTNELVATKSFTFRYLADQFQRRWQAMSAGMRFEITKN